MGRDDRGNTFGTGHSHLVADEAFFRAGGIAAVNPILDERLIFLKGALESTRAERESGLAGALIEREEITAGDVAIIISNSGRNAAPVEMALGMKARGAGVIAITNLRQSRASAPRHPGGKRLYELADVVVDNCVPVG
ncbi:MAG: sugar isomerase domain-containing protein, partial [Pyrinomonadaceae bacterium]